MVWRFTGGRARSMWPIVLALLLGFGAAAARDIRTERVAFAPGTTSTTIEGRITGYDIIDYVLGAEAGQTMIVTMTTDNSASYFNLLAPGETVVAFFIGSTEGNSFVGRLPASGDYTIRVYQMRSAARRDETARYSIEVEITSADYADGLAGGPDFWQVRAGGAGLNLRDVPSIDGRVIDRLRDGTILRNRGCRIAQGQRWCRVERPDNPDAGGWVAGDFLAESDFVPPQEQETDALVPGTAFHATGEIPCARAAGQPVGRCRFGVVRAGGGSGWVEIVWPDGNKRVIAFENGAPSGFEPAEADNDAEMTVEKAADLFTIQIGPERFEIPEAVIFGG